MDIFHFKKFKIIQNSASVFKVNTEAVLLSAWVNLSNVNSILEIGCGTGVISLGLVQRLSTNVKITAIDINIDAVELTKKNINVNQIQNVNAIHNSIQEFSIKYDSKFDLIISNPPYFDTPLKSTKKRDLLAKYTDTLNYETLIAISKSLLATNGRIALVLPYSDLDSIQKIALKNNLFLTRKWKVHTSHKKQALRILIELSTNSKNILETEDLYIKNEVGDFTEKYKEITREYYTIF